MIFHPKKILNQSTSIEKEISSTPFEDGQQYLHDWEIPLPGVLFAMRYPDNTGYVWNTIALGRDRAGAHLAGQANCFIAYPVLTANPSYHPSFVEPVELDCYDMTDSGKAAIGQFVRQYRIKVIVFMSALPSTVSLRFLRKLGVRTLNTENDSFDHRKRDPLLKKALKFVTRRVLKHQLHDLHLSNAKSQTAFLSDYAQIPSSRLALLTDGIDCERFSPGDRQAARQDLGMEQDKFWIICVAQARPEKRLEWIIRAAKRVIEARPHQKIGFLYVGDGDGNGDGLLMPQLRQVVAELGLNDDFSFLGRQDNLAPFYQASDLMVHAAERESFGLAIVEAMACGLPVVACATAGPSETIRNRETGALVSIDDFDGFVNAILGYVDDRPGTTKHGANARIHAAANYSIEQYGKLLASFIKRFL